MERSKVIQKLNGGFKIFSTWACGRDLLNNFLHNNKYVFQKPLP